MRGSKKWIASALLVGALLIPAAICSAAAPDEDAWSSGKNWMSVRAGYARSSVEDAPDVGAGYGFGFSHMIRPIKLYRWTLFKYFSLGTYVHHEMLGRFGSAAEIEIPATVELNRHFLWETPFRPYVGLGMGPFYRKLYRTGADIRTVKLGTYLAFGANTPIDKHQLLGIDARFIRIDATNDPANPVFGPGSGKLKTNPSRVARGKGTHWSLKLNYTLAY